VLYWVDAHKRRPKLVMAAAFMWGAIPAVVVALMAELFFRLPANLLGPRVLEAVRLGLLAPVLEEVLKGVGVIFIYWRYRNKFDDALAGMVYGALVGFGFAMTTNLLSYVGSFMLYGYQGVGQALVVERSVHMMDHGLYTAILGAGLGFARLAKRGRRWMIAGEVVVLAILTHTAHNLLARSLVGLNVLTVIITGAGTLVLWAIAGWSLWQRRQCIRSELRDIIPAALYHTLIKPLAGTRAQWHALRQEGLRAWRQIRRLHHLCAELAIKRMQTRLFPDEPERAAEAEALMEKINVLLNYARAPQ
jgi:RsiW-degrading membrane proteinase PrsW (M82 family)